MDTVLTVVEGRLGPHFMVDWWRWLENDRKQFMTLEYASCFLVKLASQNSFSFHFTFVEPIEY